MGVRALCITLLVLVGYVQHSYPHTSDSAFSIVPTALQVFEYETVSFSCKGFNVSAGWKVRNIHEFISKCSDGPVTSGITCTIEYAFVSDSGEYWCEREGGERSNNVTITVTAGSVVLESHVLPVMEGDTVTLRCRNKKFSNLTAHFYKDDLLIGTSDTGKMTIHSVSESHEGLYKCVSGAESSPVSPLTVRALHRNACPCSDQSLYIVLLLRTVFTIVMVPLLLVLVGLLHCGKLGAPQNISADK